MFESIILFFSTNPLVELGFITILLVLFGLLARACKQPLLVGYILAGIVVSPQLLNLISNHENIELYAHFGVSLLLFMVGLGLNPRIIKEVGKIAVIVGLGQVLITSVVGFFITIALGFDIISSVYIAIALTFSSTIVIVKLISDRGDTATVYGKIALGVLVIQDVLAMLILMVISASMMPMVDGGIALFVLIIVAKVVALGLFVWLVTKYMLPSVIAKLSHTPEVMTLFVISWALLLGGLWYYAGFSMEIGALLAGFSLASSHYRFHIASELRPLRDFFVALFFVSLGSQIMFDSVTQYSVIIVVLSLFVLIGNPIIVMTLMGLFGYTSKNSFMTGLTVAQISEFSFVVIALAITAGHITNPAILSIVTVIGVITMAGSSYFFAYADPLYKKLEPYLSIFENKGLLRKKEKEGNISHSVILIGYNRIGKLIARNWKNISEKPLVVEYNPERIREAQSNGFDSLYGDVNNVDILSEKISDQTQRVCSTVIDYDTNRSVIEQVKRLNKKTKVICVAHYTDEAADLYAAGADYVIIPHQLGAHKVRTVIQQHIREAQTQH